jgi:hypothetical protein
VLCGSSKKARTEHVGVVDGTLAVGKITETIALSSFLAWKLKDPVARALRNTEKPFVPRNFESLNVCLADQAGPHDDGIAFCVGTTATHKIKMIAPTVVLKA